MSRKHRRGGILSDEDRALWRTVTAGVTPLNPDKAPPSPPDPSEKPSPPTPEPDEAAPAKPKRIEKANGTHRAVILPPPVPKPSKPTPGLAGIDRRTLREIFRGARAVQGRVDLHGLTQVEAHDRLVGFLRGAQARGARLVLVITGKSRGYDEAGKERGILRRMTPHWLGSRELRDVVLGFASAGPGHGGEGAFYVSLRRKRG